MFICDVPGANVVLKVPKTEEEMEMAMDETHTIEYLYDWKGCEGFLIKPREELLVYDKDTKKLLFYCSFYERV